MDLTCVRKFVGYKWKSSALIFITIPCLLLVIVSCNSVRIAGSDGIEKKYSSVEKYIKHSPTLQTYMLGMELYDLEESKSLISHQSTRYFTPASLTKWLTLYAASQHLGDSTAWMNIYEIEGQTIFEPLGDPSFLHPNLQNSPQVMRFIQNLPKDTLYWSTTHFVDEAYGSGWAWDDMGYSFQPEKTVFPTGQSPIDQWLNNFGKVFLETNLSLVDQEAHTTIYNTPIDSVYQVMMQKSDNGIAEQLLLQVSQGELGVMNTAEIIAHLLATDPLLQEVAPFWVDGSGLSRYNMVTPKGMVQLINQLVEEKGIDWLTTILPSGGESGTITNYYKYDPPRVFAKTGTLRHNHNLAGLVQAKSGKWYSFCIMNNHIPGSSSIAKAEMENIIQLIIELY